MLGSGKKEPSYNCCLYGGGGGAVLRRTQRKEQKQGGTTEQWIEHGNSAYGEIWGPETL